MIEAALLRADFLLTSDTHLLSIDRDKLNAFLVEKEIHKVQVVSPRGIYARLRRM